MAGRGRPKIGGDTHLRLGDLLPRVDAYAAAHNLKRPEAVRRLLTIALDQEGVPADDASTE